MRKKIDLVNQTDVGSAPPGPHAAGGAPAGTAAQPAHHATAAPPADDVLEAIHGLMHLVRAQQHRALREQASDLSPMEGRVLGFFARHPGATLSELAAHSGRDKGQLARLVAALRERGLLEATVDAQDRRVTRLHLSAAAQLQHQALMKLRRQLARQAASGLGADERAQLLALLAKVRAALSAA